VKKALVLIVVTMVLFFALSGVALAATPQDIYDDYDDNGRLDGTYTDAELIAYLNSAYVHQYGEPTVLTELDSIVRSILSARDRFPFTGFQIALFVIVALALVGAGVGLRRLARRQS
jgi:hypothetical protein